MRRFLYSKFILLLVMLFSFCSVSPGYADDDSEGSFASLSPEFLQWQQEHKQQENTSDIPAYYSKPSSEHPNGYIPLPVDFSHLANNLPVENADTSLVINVKSNVGADALPSEFDLRDVNGKSYVSSIKSQSPWGTCWAHAALGSMESNYMMQGKSELNLSEMHLAWFTYKNSDKSRAFGDYNNSGLSTIMDLGGNAFYPAALFSRLSGPASESDVPYGSTRPSGSTPEDYTQRLRLRDAYYLSMNERLNVNSSEEQRNIVKRRIMQNGAVAANYYNNDLLFYKVASGNTSYHTTSKTPNHAIQIVGWDDNYPASNFRTKPKSNGAWLIKNSWGERWYTLNGYMGDSGYFWMSYETYLTDGTSFVVEDVNNKMKVYEYDPLGICSLWGYSGSTVYAANVFRAEDDETLTEIGLYTADNNLGYEINIYTGMSSMPSGSPVYGSSVSSASGTISFAGYHTIALNTPVELSSGEYFSVVVKFKGYGMTSVERVVSGFSDNAAIEEGSFFSNNGTSWTSGSKNKINACIKAFTVTGSVSGTAPKISDSYPPDGQVNTAYSATLTATGTKPVTWSVSSGTLPEGLSLSSSGTISGTPTEACNKTFTVKAANSYGSDTKTFTINIYDLPSITTESLDGYAGYAFTGQLTLSQSASAKWKAETTMPSGLKLNANTGAITGKPSKAGEYLVTFSASTSLGVSAKNVTIVIYDKPIKPAIKTSSLAQGNIDTEYSQELVITGTYPITVTITGLPNGLSVNSSTGYISGTPSAAGTYSVKITAENLATELENKPVTKTLKLEIKAQPPVIDFTDDALPDAAVGEAYSYTFSTSSGTEPFTWNASGLPSGMKFSSGTLSGTPTKAGNFKITLNVSNSGGKTTLKIPLTVLQAPVITTPNFANATTGKKYSAKISAKGTTPISWDVSGLPDTLEYSYNKTGTTLSITGTPEEMNTYSITVTASNAAGTSSVSAELKVSGVAPKLKATLGKGSVGTAYTDSNISATGTKPVTFGYSISNSDKAKFGIDSLDDLGLSFEYDAEEGTADITGTPTRSVKSLPITITAENAASNGKAVSKTVKLTIAGQKPAFTEPDDSSITMKVLQEESISLNFTVTGTPDITFSMNKTTGFTLTQTGDYTATLSGTAPSKDGKTNITVTAANADGKATRKIIIQTYTAPKITTSSLSAGTLNKTYSAKLAVTGTKTIKWTLDGDLPEGMKFNKGTFSGKPKEAGTFELSVTAENDIGTDTKDFTLTISDPNNVTSIPQEDPEHEDAYHDDDSIPEDTASKTESESESEAEAAITFGNERNELSLSAGQSAMLNEGGYTIVKVLPEMKVSESAMYDIEVELDESIETGAKLIWFAFPKDYESSDDDEIAEFYDESGAEIDCVPESHKFTVGAWLNEGVTYEPVIAVKNKE
ncbi:MAG: putative Ig domain-containing protein [Synergistaceae bacterium]|nr:putative Ig domain-containing protein [Synergistaceae bacterium]